MRRFVDVDAFKEWLLENSINEREVEESKQIGIWIDAFYSMQNEQSDCEDCIKHGGDWECDRVHCHKGDAISRTAAIDGVKTLHDVAWKNWHEPTLSANVVLDMIRELPSAQPERKNGKWIKDDGDWFETMFRCSVCGAMIREQDKFRSFFCYHCGADMREG